jgi:predicted alpha/beta superfamily hydrolase
MSARRKKALKNRMPAAIIVGIGYGTLDLENGNHRSRDLSPQAFPGRPESGGGPRFLEFLLEEVMPLLESNYPVDPETRYLFGHSLGGLFALYAYIEEPEAFAGIIAGSPFLKGQLPFLSKLASGVDRPSRRSCRLFVATGDQESADFFINDMDALENYLTSGWAAPESFRVEHPNG